MLGHRSFNCAVEIWACDGNIDSDIYVVEFAGGLRSALMRCERCLYDGSDAIAGTER
jgi:hypothetical protein